MTVFWFLIAFEFWICILRWICKSKSKSNSKPTFRCAFAKKNRKLNFALQTTLNPLISCENLSNLFRNNNLRPYDDELISFLRRVDRNDDGIIDWRELDEFVSLIVAKK